MTKPPTYRPFIKAHGLLNDFVIFDARTNALDLDSSTVARIADRRAGVGCDQLIVLEPSDTADCFMTIYNADGSEVGACGNATRCVGDILAREAGHTSVHIETRAGLLVTERLEGGIRVDMGTPKLKWQDIPLSGEADTAAVDLSLGPLKTPVCVNMGNPHAVFFLDDAEAVDLAALGPELEHHAVFPERANISVAEIRADGIRLRVWERGAGITPACGTAACATLVAAVRRGLIKNRSADIILDGGTLEIAWDDATNHVFMTGETHTVFEGQIAL